jgi:hypothetical protein
MNPELSKITPLFLAHVSHFGRDREKLCVVLGAGADISSGGMTFRQLKRSCLEHFRYSPAIPLMSETDLDHAFDLFLEDNSTEIERAAIIEYIFHGFESAKPSDGYKLLVLLAKEGIVDCVVTTNFDALLEIAQRELRLDVFQIYAPGVASPFVAGDQIYLPHAPIYLKVHGDIRAQLITHITKRDIHGKEYPTSFSLLLRQILATHRLLFVGYGGTDEIFANELKAVAPRILRPVYWCNVVPPDRTTPLAHALEGIDTRWVRATFEEIFTEGSVTWLGAGSPLEANVQFVAPLIKERCRQMNDHFLAGFFYASRSDRLKLLIPRRSVTEILAVFRANPTKPLAVITGSSGVGKSTILVQLCDSAANDAFSNLIVIRARSIITSGDFARDLTERLGYAAENPLALLYHFSSWLRSRNEQLLIAVDALNEFNPLASECVKLFREIIRVALWVQYHGALKIIITLRPESWNEIFSLVDISDLAKVLWCDTEFRDKISAIHLDRFNVEELDAAYNSYAKHYAIATPLRLVDAAARQLLADPYLLALAMQTREVINAETLDADIFRRAHQQLLEGSFGHQTAEAVEISLARLASLCLEKKATQFSIADLATVNLSQDQLSVLREINILGQLSPATFCFSHDRVHESYLVIAINELASVRILDIDDLTKNLTLASEYPRLRAALRQCFANPPHNLDHHYTGLLFEALDNALARNSLYAPRSQQLLHEFAKDTILTIAGNSPERFTTFAEAFFEGEENGSRAEAARVLLHAACLLTADRCAPLMISLTRSRVRILREEAMILLYDKIVSKLLREPASAAVLINDGAFADFVVGPALSPYLRIIRVLGLVSQIGPDNTHPAEWTALSSCLQKALIAASSKAVVDDDFLLAFPDLVVTTSNRYLFNAEDTLLENYFMSESRKTLWPIFEKLNAGSPLELDDVSRLRPFIAELGHTTEFIICNLLFVLSMKADQEATLRVFYGYFSRFDGDTNPEEIDFFLSALCLSRLSLGLPFQDLASDYTAQILSRLPQAILLNPGAVRGQRRARFSDPFDQQFEDGFNPLAYYFYNAPARERQAVGYGEYLRGVSQGDDLLPLYWKYLADFEARGLSVGTLRIIHALGQMIGIWPFEGLKALQKLVGRTDPLIRRAIIRILAEAFARFPADTMLLMAQSGSAFTDSEKFDIKCGTDPRLTERSFEQLQWSRVLFFLEMTDKSGCFICDVTRLLLKSISLPEALKAILKRVAAVGGSGSPR